jgi:2-hydroxycyclohexanecarboxyl-CoA dehydrogenase
LESLAGRTAFITGGARGIGLGIARACLREGVKVAIVDLDREVLASAKADLNSLGIVETWVLDVRDRVAYAGVADDVESQLGPVSLLFNNAGVISSVSPSKMEYVMWDWMIDINLHGVYNGIQTFVPRMIARGDDSYMVNTSSGAGLATTGSGFLYHASKYAVVGLSEALHSELTHHHIGVSVLCPGMVATDIVTNTVSMRPDDAIEPSARVQGILGAASAALHEFGASAEEVGDMVIDAVKHNRFWIHTDDSMSVAIETRTEAILAAMPNAERVGMHFAKPS